jgi:hypothetical protein
VHSVGAIGQRRRLGCWPCRCDTDAHADLASCVQFYDVNATNTRAWTSAARDYATTAALAGCIR